MQINQRRFRLILERDVLACFSFVFVTKFSEREVPSWLLIAYRWLLIAYQYYALTPLFLQNTSGFYSITSRAPLGTGWLVCIR